MSIDRIAPRRKIKWSDMRCAMPAALNGEHVDIVFGIVAAEGRGRGDDGAELWLRLRAAGFRATLRRRRSMLRIPSLTLDSPSLISIAAQRPSFNSMMASTSSPSESP